MGDDLSFERWQPVTPDGAVYRQSVIVRRGPEEITEVETRLAYTAGSQLMGKVGRDLTEDELQDAMARYAEDEVRRRVESGDELDPFMMIEVTGYDDDLLLPYLQASEHE